MYIIIKFYNVFGKLEVTILNNWDNKGTCLVFRNSTTDFIDGYIYTIYILLYKRQVFFFNKKKQKILLNSS